MKSDNTSSDDKDKTLVEYFQPQILDLLPLGFSMTEEMPRSQAAVRLASSDIYHSDGYFCTNFYKPISRCEE